LHRIPLANRCVPRMDDLITSELKKKGLDKGLKDFLNSDMVRLSLVELYKQLPKMAYLGLAALAITLLLVFLLRYIAKLMVLLVLLSTSIGSIGETNESIILFYCSGFIRVKYALLMVYYSFKPSQHSPG
jgi:hypothetical protein